MSRGVSWELQGGVWELVLDRPPCNEIGSVVLEELEAFVRDVEAETASRAVILRSAQKSGFCAGADLRELYASIVGRSADSYAGELRGFLDRIHAVMDRLDTLPLTTIGVVHGVCFGGGFELALTCDLLIAERNARFCFPELRLGIIPGFGGIPRLKRDLPGGLVRDLLLTGRSINAKKAVATGLVSQMVAPGEGLGVARMMATQTGKFDAEAARTAKAFCKALPAAELAEEKEHFVRLFQRPVVIEALRRFVESEDVRPYLP